MSEIELSKRVLRSQVVESVQEPSEQVLPTQNGRGNTRGRRQVQGQVQGRGRGGGRGRGKGRRTGHIAGAMDTLSEGLVQFTKTSQPQPMVFGSETGSCSDTGSNSSMSSARRDPTRRARPKSTSASSVDNSSNSDAPNVNETNSRAKSTRKVRQKSSLISRNRALRQIGMLPPISSMLSESLLPSSTSTISQSHHHPLFLDLLQRGNLYSHSMNPQRDGKTLDNNPPYLPETDMEPHESTQPPSGEIVEGLDANMETHGIDPTIENETTRSFFCFIPSAHSRKRPRTPTFEAESLLKAHCRYPDQSVRNQAEFEESISNRQVKPRVALRAPNSGKHVPQSRIRVPTHSFDDGFASWPWPPPWYDTPGNTERPMDLTTGLEDEEMTPRQSHMCLPPLLGANSDNTNSTSPPQSTEPPHLPGGLNTKQQTTPVQMEQDESGLTDPSIIAPGGDAHLSTGYTNGPIPLMEYRQPDLISRQILEHIQIIGLDIERRWENTRPLANQPIQDPRYRIKAFRMITLPDLLFSGGRSGKKGIQPPGNRHASEIYLTIVVYLHLLGLRAVTSFRTGHWEMAARSTSSCTLSNFTPLLASVHVPHNQVAKQIFVSHFLRVTHAKLYSVKCIGGGLLNEEKVGRAFEHALKVQMLLQRQDMDHVHRQQHAAAIRIGKWLMLHQVFWISEENTLAALIGKIGPNVCSSDKSDDVDTNGAGQEPRNHASHRQSRMTSQRSPEFAAFMDLIQRSGLYYRKQTPRSEHLTIDDNSSVSQLPPDGTPLAWISEEFMMELMAID